jgi:hypothetical protein
VHILDFYKKRDIHHNYFGLVDYLLKTIHKAKKIRGVLFLIYKGAEIQVFENCADLKLGSVGFTISGLQSSIAGHIPFTCQISAFGLLSHRLIETILSQYGALIAFLSCFVEPGSYST